jgi:hypothetical protein
VVCWRCFFDFAGLHNVYISGNTNGSLGGPNAGGADAFVAKYFDPLPGDYNGDGVVDAADYTVWRDQFAQVVPPGSGADGDGNGFVNGSDYQIWEDHFGESNLSGTGAVAQSSGGVVAQIPEPPCWLLLAVAMAIALSIRWQQSIATLVVGAISGASCAM